MQRRTLVPRPGDVKQGEGGGWVRREDAASRTENENEMEIGSFSRGGARRHMAIEEVGCVFEMSVQIAERKKREDAAPWVPAPHYLTSAQLRGASVLHRFFLAGCPRTSMMIVKLGVDKSRRLFARGYIDYIPK